MTAGAITLAAPLHPPDWQRARGLLEAYADSLGLDLGYQDFDTELERLAIEYAAPDGAFLLASAGAAPVGCVGVRRFAADTAELKRMYVAPSVRGRGVGRQLAEGIVAAARALGYRRVVLDSWPSMQAAQALYVSLGFLPIAPYRFSPVPDTAYYALTLD